MTAHSFSIHSASPADLQTLCRLDPLAQSYNVRAKFIKHSIESKYCHVVQSDEEPLGFGVMDYSFFGNPFISILFIVSDRRRLGAGSELICYMESISRTDKLFTSTNLSNQPMQSLLRKLHYSPSGIFHNLDENDPELIFFKSLNSCLIRTRKFSRAICINVLSCFYLAGVSDSVG